jgi:hypothetical protein
MTDHGKEESEGEEASGSKGKARSCQEGRRQEGREEESEEGEQSKSCNEGEEGKEGGAEEGGCKEGSAEEGGAEEGAREGRIGSEESDGTAEACGSGRTALYAGIGSHAEQRLRTRAAAAVDKHGSFRLNGDRQGSVARINRGGMRAALLSVITPIDELTRPSMS